MDDPQVPSFSQPWKNSDAVLVVEEKELHVHTTILSLASPVFEKMFDGNFKESQTKRVELHEKSYELVEHILKLIYPNFAVSLDLNSNKVCSDCSTKKDIQPPCSLKATSNHEICIMCHKFFVFTKHQKKRRLEHLRQLYNFSEEFLMDALIQKVSFEAIRLSNEESNRKSSLDDLELKLELLVFSDFIKCKKSLANCLSFIPTKYSITGSLNKRKCLSDLLIQFNVRSELRLKLMGLILKKHLDKIIPQRYENIEAWDDIDYIADDMMKNE